MTNRMTLPIALLASVPLAPPVHAVEMLTNGNFTHGLAGWTTFTNPGGVIGTPTVTPFDIDGDGLSESAVELNVGRELYQYDVWSGGGLAQNFTLASAGEVIFNVGLAVRGGSVLNATSGRFSLLVDGVELARLGSQWIEANEIIRSSFAHAGIFSAGTHTLQLLATRYAQTAEHTPRQYFGNVSAFSEVGVAPVPEPTSWALLILGFGITGAALRSRKRAEARFALA